MVASFAVFFDTLPVHDCCPTLAVVYLPEISNEHAPAPNRTRLAPSPTGALHLGNARTFLVNWVLARQNGWQVRLRIDDLDGPRVKKGADAAAIEDLAWLGLDWSSPIERQSGSVARYQGVLHYLVQQGRAYACRCTRREVEAQRKGFAADSSSIYSGTCRTTGRLQSLCDSAANGACIRFEVGAPTIRFDDGFSGTLCFDARRDIGDFVIRKADGTPAYQLACAVDDLDAGVTHIVRGADLLASTARQITLYNVIRPGAAIPQFIHLPLVVGTEGRKLAKRHGDTTLRTLREEGVTAGQIRSMLARWSGFEPSGSQISIDEWVERFDLARLPTSPVVYEDATDRPGPL